LKIIFNGFQRKNRFEYPKNLIFEAPPTDFNGFFGQLFSLKLRFSIRSLFYYAKVLAETAFLRFKNGFPRAILKNQAKHPKEPLAKDVHKEPLATK